MVAAGALETVAAAGGSALGEAAVGSADATPEVALAEVAALGATGLVLATGADGATLGAPDDEVGAGISSVLNGVGLSPSGTAPDAGTATPLLFCMFRSAAGGTATEKVGSYMRTDRARRHVMHLAVAQRVNESHTLIERERTQVGLVAHHMRRQEHQQVVLLLIGRGAGEQIAEDGDIRNPRYPLALNVVVV